MPIWSDDLRVATPPNWMLELAEQVGMIEPGALLSYRVEDNMRLSKDKTQLKVNASLNAGGDSAGGV